MPVNYDPERGIFHNALRLKATVVEQVLRRAELYVLFTFHCAVSVLYKTGYFIPAKYDLELTMRMTGVTGSLMVFFVVFYNGNVFARYVNLYAVTNQVCEDSMILAAYLVRVVPDRNTVRKLSRMLIASALIFFYERTMSPEEGSRDYRCMDEFDHLEAMGFIDHYEKEVLEKHCHILGHEAIPSFLLLQWSMSLYRTMRPKHVRAPDLDKVYWRLWSRQEEAIHMMDMPMPFQYFHIINWLMLYNLIFWAYSFAVMDSVVATVIYLTIQLVFQGIRELTIAMADPFGFDDSDFPVNEWANVLYKRVVALVEDPWEMSKALPVGEIPPLPQPKRGEMMLNLSIDEVIGSAKYNAGLDMNAPEDTDGYAMYGEPSGDEDRNSGRCGCLRLQPGKWAWRTVGGPGRQVQIGTTDHAPA